MDRGDVGAFGEGQAGNGTTASPRSGGDSSTRSQSRWDSFSRAMALVLRPADEEGR